MAMKVMVLLVACVLLVTARVSSFEADLVVAMHPPVMAPAHAPAKHQPWAPEKAPVYPPTKHVAPTSPVVPKRCAQLCLDYCEPIDTSKKRVCQRVCSKCCAKCDCVPEKYVKCNNWDTVLYHGESVKCP